MHRSFSVAHARINLPSLVHDAEKGVPVEITRRGKPVAVLVSAIVYRRLAEARPRFWDAMIDFRERANAAHAGLDAGDLRTLRDSASGRKVQW